jgi:actin-like ATPase involved in cell morphogenesis
MRRKMLSGAGTGAATMGRRIKRRYVVGYSLGVDLGTTFTAAAISDHSQAEMVTLGERSVVTPSVVFVREDGVVVSGDAAARRAASAPERAARTFKRRLGDPTPLRLAGTSYGVTELLGLQLRDVLTKVTDTRGAPPERVVLTHPANWGAFRRGLFEEVPRQAGLAGSLLITEPEAAAAHYAASRQLGTGEVVAVYDLGGGTFDATVVRKLADGVETLGTPEGVERLGGVDFDQAVFDFVNFSSDGALDELDQRDPRAFVALARLRQDCVLAKEALSADTETLLPVFLPEKQFDVRITRAEFENLVRAQIESTISGLARALRSAEVTAADLSAVLLVGGSSRIPLVAEMVSEELGRPILVDTHPKYAVALGAATVARLPSTARANGVVPGSVPFAGPMPGAGPLPGAGPAPGAGSVPGARPVPGIGPVPGGVAAAFSGPGSSPSSGSFPGPAAFPGLAPNPAPGPFPGLAPSAGPARTVPNSAPPGPAFAPPLPRPTPGGPAFAPPTTGPIPTGPGRPGFAPAGAPRTAMPGGPGFPQPTPGPTHPGPTNPRPASPGQPPSTRSLAAPPPPGTKLTSSDRSGQPDEQPSPTSSLGSKLLIGVAAVALLLAAALVVLYVLHQLQVG